MAYLEIRYCLNNLSYPAKCKICALRLCTEIASVFNGYYTKNMEKNQEKRLQF